MPTGFTIAPDGKSITCHVCGMTSHNPHDVANFYCGNCHAFHADHDAAVAAVADPAAVAVIVDAIRSALAGKLPSIQGAVIADLLSIFIAGHHPDLRDQIFRQTVDCARDMIEANDHLLFPHGRPPGWPPR